MNKTKKLLKQIPFVYSILNYLRYFYFRYLKEKRIKNVYLNNKVTIEKIEYSKNRQSFFGYYNISPSNCNEDIIFGEVETDNIRGSKIEPLKIFLKHKNEIKNLGQSNSWNWQQGCMLQWYAESNDRIIFNDYSPEKKIHFNYTRC